MQELQEVTIEGYVDHIIFRNEENGYTVLNLMCDGEEMTCVGMFPYLSEGEMIQAKGGYVEHASYGKQFKVSSYGTKVPEDAVAIERYLGSGAVKGVGSALAARIVRRFGEDTLRIMEEEPERLAEIKGISPRKAQEIAVQVEGKAEMRNAMIFLQQYGISVSLGMKIYTGFFRRILTRWRKIWKEWDLRLQTRLRRRSGFIQIQIIGSEAVFSMC